MHINKYIVDRDQIEFEFLKISDLKFIDEKNMIEMRDTIKLTSLIIRGIKFDYKGNQFHVTIKTFKILITLSCFSKTLIKNIFKQKIN